RRRRGHDYGVLDSSRVFGAQKVRQGGGPLVGGGIGRQVNLEIHRRHRGSFSSSGSMPTSEIRIERGVHIRVQPFTAPSVRPRTRRRCMNNARANTGSIAINASAEAAPSMDAWVP